MQHGSKQEAGDAAPSKAGEESLSVYEINASAVSDGTTYAGGPVSITGSCVICAVALIDSDGRHLIPLEVSDAGAQPGEIGFRTLTIVPVTFTITKGEADIAGVTVERSGSGQAVRIA